MPFALNPARSAPRESLAPADRWIALQASLLIGFSSWAAGGGLAWVPPTMLAVSLLGLPAIWLRRIEGQAVSLAAFCCLGAWLLLCGISLLNPSHMPAASGGWLPRPGWIHWLPATVDRGATLRAEWPWLAALLEASVLVAVRPHRRVVRIIWSVAALNGFALAATGAAFLFRGTPEMLGFIAPPEASYFFATFFYKNHWAAYGALCAATGIALALRSWDRAQEGDPAARGRVVLFSATSLLTAITLPLPGSRTGALLAVFLVGLWLVGLALRLRGKRRTLSLLMLTGIGFATAGYGYNVYRTKAQADLQRTVRQWDAARHDEAPDLRLLLSRDTWHMARDRPWLGWGMGSFELVFPVYQGDYLRDANGHSMVRFEAAHDDWMQMLAEAGGAGLMVLLIPAVRMARRGWRSGRAGRPVLAGCAAIAAIAWFDFPLNSPAVLALWSVLLVSAEWVERGSSPARPEGHRTAPVSPSA